MINPMTVMKLLNERKEFLEHNPDLYPFTKKWFGSRMKKGTMIEIKILSPSGEEETVKIEVGDSETSFFAAVRQLFS